MMAVMLQESKYDAPREVSSQYAVDLHRLEQARRAAGACLYRLLDSWMLRGENPGTLRVRYMVYTLHRNHQVFIRLKRSPRPC